MSTGCLEKCVKNRLLNQDNYNHTTVTNNTASKYTHTVKTNKNQKVKKQKGEDNVHLSEQEVTLCCTRANICMLKLKPLISFS